MTGLRTERIKALLTSALAPSSIEVTDQSHLHAGHAGARAGLGHFHVRIVSDQFAGLRRVERHRLVFEALGNMMRTDIHALAINALTTSEAVDTASDSETLKEDNRR